MGKYMPAPLKLVKPEPAHHVLLTALLRPLSPISTGEIAESLSWRTWRIIEQRQTADLSKAFYRLGKIQAGRAGHSREVFLTSVNLPGPGQCVSVGLRLYLGDTHPHPGYEPLSYKCT